MKKLYDYQERVLHAIMNGKNVILQAPTGAGKTFAALYPYFQQLDIAQDNSGTNPLPMTCRYAVPMRVLATQFQREYDNFFPKIEQRGASYLRRYQTGLGLYLPSIQTGETPEDPQFESPLTFCTIDQLLASFIGTPYGMGQGRGNLNVGAIVGSYLILDEFHLYPLDGSSGARTTTLAMLRLLKDFSPFVLMTATFSTHLLEELGKLLDATVVEIMDDKKNDEGETELEIIMQGRTRTIRRADQPLSAEAVLTAHEAARLNGSSASLVVCNTVARAQEIYLDLCNLLLEGGLEQQYRVQLLHSRFTAKDRKEKSANLEKWIGAACWRKGHFVPLDGKEVIVVGTQVVEVGLNISSRVLHTELAPANSLIQRAGRCARFAKQQGEVIVYPLAPNRKGNITYLPYRQELCLKTWQQLGNEPVPFDFIAEQNLINSVHTDEDEQMLQAFRTNERGIQQTIEQVLQTHERGKEGELIRNVEQTSLIIHPKPHDAITVYPFLWQHFGVYPTALVGVWEDLVQREQAMGLDAPGWIFKILRLKSDPTKDEDDNERPAEYGWEKLTLVGDNNAKLAQVRGALLIAVHPAYATYNHEVGFRFIIEPAAPTGTWESEDEGPKHKPKTQKKNTSQRSYLQHITGLYQAYTWSVRNEITWVATRLEQKLHLAPDRIDRAVCLAIACHDIGKLSKGWQRWALAWQRRLLELHSSELRYEPRHQFFAKTDQLDDWKLQRKLQKDLGVSRPHHAAESAAACYGLLEHHLLSGVPDDEAAMLAPLLEATMSAIIRHHSATANGSHEPVAWDSAARSVIADALRACQIPGEIDGLDISAKAKNSIAVNYLSMPNFSSDQIAATWLAFIIVRALRLCDQRAERYIATN